MVCKIFFCSEFPDIPDKANRKMRRRRRRQVIAKLCVFHTKAIKSCCLFFDYTGNTIDETGQQQHLNQYINIYLLREFHKTSFIRSFIVTPKI